MLKAEIVLRDLACPPQWSGGALALGESWIRPHVHGALETLFVHAEGQWFLVVRERHAGLSTEAAIGPVDAERFGELYRASLTWPLDYVMIEGARDGHRLRVRSGVYGAAPVYCRSTTEKLSISWDLADFIGGVRSIDFDIASHFLALGSIYSAQHLCSGITLLTERASLFAEPGKARYQYPAAAEAAAPSRDPWSEAEAVEAFGTLLHAIVSARPATADRIAVELSGGMDSATVASVLATSHGAVGSRGILLGGDERDVQVRRREKIVRRLGLLDETVDIDAHLPSLDLQPGQRMVYPHAELYLEAFDRLWGSARAQGREMLYTGVGGDELFPTYRQESARASHAGGALVDAARAHAAKLLTARAQDALGCSRMFDAPASPLPVSSLLASTCQAPHLLRHGLWPVNPLSDPRLVAFCYRLPKERRHGRATMRGYLRERLGGDVFPPDYTKETFARVLPGLISRHATTIAAQLRECALADLGLVDHRAALDLLQDVAATRGDAPAAPLISFLWLERFVRQLASAQGAAWALL